MVDSFPLRWPGGFQRTKEADKRYGQFICTVAQARDGVLRQISLLNGKNPVISSNVPVKKDGTMYGGRGSIDGDNGIAVYFTWDNEQYVLACDQYFSLQDNLRAIEKSIDALRGLKRWGASDILKRAFTGFKALPPARTVWEVLNLPEDATYEDITKAYRLLAKKYHPDNQETGDANKFDEVKKAYDKAMSL